MKTPKELFNDTKQYLSGIKPTLRFKVISGSLIVLLLAIMVGLVLAHNHTVKVRRELRSIQSVNVPTEKTLLIKLNIGPAPDFKLSLGSIEQYNSRVDKVVNRADSQYKLRFFGKDNKILYVNTFDIPVSHSEGINPTTKEFESIAFTTATSISFRVPNYPEGTTIQVSDKDELVVLKDSIKNVKFFNNQADYKTTTGGDNKVN